MDTKYMSRLVRQNGIYAVVSLLNINTKELLP
jgi:hypothetical protein